MGHATDIIRRELPHLTPVVIDGAVGVLTPTLVYFLAGAKALVAKGDGSWASWLLLLGESGVVALTALGAFRSKAFITWQDGKKRRDETEEIARTARTSGHDPEQHLR